MTISSQEGFYAHLDRENEEREDLHKQALATATQKHERVRQSAEIERRRLEEEQEARQRQEEEEQRRALEIQRRENELAEQRREIERVRAAEQHERELAEVRRSRDEIEGRQKAEKQRLDADVAKNLKEEREARQQRQQATEAAEAKAKENAKAAVTTTRPQPSPAIPSATTKPSSQPAPLQSSIPPEWELEHNRYLEIHRHLKDLRKSMTKTAKERPELKDEMGNMRRAIKKSVGQLNKSKGGNTKPLKAIIETLKHALTLPSPQIPIPTFLAHPPSPPPPQGDSSTGPALLVYLLNTFSKDIISQFISEAGVDPSAADSIGLIASHIFALPHFRWHSTTSISLIDILLAKMHVVAPALFGIYASESTAVGKRRLGWLRDEDSPGGFIDTQSHNNRMTGLAAGYAALTLRNYSATRSPGTTNPLPESHYWICLARLTYPATTNPEGMTQTHLVLLKGLVEGYEERLIGFFGGAGVAALRVAVVDLPARCGDRPAMSVACKSLAGLRGVLAREKKLFL